MGNDKMLPSLQAIDAAELLLFIIICNAIGYEFAMRISRRWRGYQMERMFGGNKNPRSSIFFLISPFRRSLMTKARDEGQWMDGISINSKDVKLLRMAQKME
jgi:hypothetical protein